MGIGLCIRVGKHLVRGKDAVRALKKNGKTAELDEAASEIIENVGDWVFNQL